MKNGGLQKLETELKKVYLIDDPHIVKVLLALLISQFTSSDPAWTVIVAPSGGLKSELINTLSLFEWTPPGQNEMKQVVTALSTLTARTFVSGYKAAGKDPSLLTQISRGIITIKDSMLTNKWKKLPCMRMLVKTVQIFSPDKTEEGLTAMLSINPL